MKATATITMFVFISASSAAASTDCAVKKQRLQRQIEYAKTYGNHYRVEGLERALMKVNRYCNDSDVVYKCNEKIREKEQKVIERTTELRNARETGDKIKIANKKRKLEQAKAELAEVMSYIGE